MKGSARKLSIFTEAYMAYYPQIFNSILARVGDVDDARDICQEVFIILYEKFDSVNNVRSWLYGTLKNVVYRYYAAKNRNIDNIDELFDSAGLAFTNGFRDTRIIINEAIERIGCSDDERIILDLIARHNFSYANVAKILGLTRQVQYKYGQLVNCILTCLKEKGIIDIAELL